MHTMNNAAQPLIMYVVCKDNLLPGMLALACAHGSLGCYLTHIKLSAMIASAPQIEWPKAFKFLRLA